MDKDTDIAEHYGTIAALLVENKVIDISRLEFASRIRSKLDSDQPILNVLKEIGEINDQDIRHVISDSQGLKIRIGDFLLELGLINQEDLTLALKIQRESEDKLKLGEILIERRMVDEKQMARVLANQLGYEFKDVSSKDADLDLYRDIAPDWLEEAEALPLQKNADGKLLAIVVDPLNHNALDAVSGITRMEVEPVVVTSSNLALFKGQVSRARQNRFNPQAVDESTAVGIVEQLILQSFQMGASDIHIEPTRSSVRVRMRIDGVLQKYRDIDPEIYPSVVTRIKILSGANIAEKRRHQDGRILYEDENSGISLDMRASFFVTVHGESVVLRLLGRQEGTVMLPELGMPPALLRKFQDDALDIPSGVIIITGPTGSGKTTTLYSCIHYLNNDDTSIITAEDPVETLVDGISQCSINPKIDVTFNETLRHMVRQDPDVIVLGEIRDQFSAETAIQAALTGHKVLTTFHTEDSIGGLLRLLNMNIEAFLISSTVVCVVAQRLVRRVCPSCSKPVKADHRLLRRLGCEVNEFAAADFRHGDGCHDCHYTGYRGRVPIFEALVLNDQVKDAILGKQTSTQIRRISMESSGLVTLLEDGLVKAANGQTTLEELLKHLPRLAKPRSLAELRRLTGTIVE